MKKTTAEIFVREQTQAGGDLSTKQTSSAITEQFKAIFEALPIGICLVDADFRLRYVNPKALPHFGNLPDLMDKNFEEVVRQLNPEQVAMDILQIFRNVLETGEPFVQAEYQVNHPVTGAAEFYEWQINRVAFPDGRLGVACCFNDISAQVLARQAVEASEKKMRLIMDSMPGLISYVDAERRYAFVNQAYEQWFGHRREDIVGKYLWEVLGEEAYRGLIPQVEKVFAGERLSFERWIDYKDGGARYVQVSYLPDFGTDGKVKGYFAQVNDLTERKRHEMKMHLLATLAEHFQRITSADELLQTVCELTAKHFDATHCLFSQVDQQRNLAVNLTEWRSEPAPSMLGTFRLSDYPAATVSALSRGQTIRVSDAKTDEETAAFYETLYAPVGARAILAAPMMKNQAWVGSLVVNHSKPRQWTAQQVEFLSIVAERTWTTLEKLRGEEALRESEARFRTLADSSPAPIWVANVHGGNEFVNKAYLDFYAVTLEEMEGFGWRVLIHPEDDESYFQSFLSAVQNRTKFQGQVRVLNFTGSYRWVDCTAIPRFSTSGEFLGFIGASFDVTEIKQAEQVLREKNKELEYFAYITSHDLQEPVNTIGSYIELIESELPPDENLTQFVGFIKDSCQRMKQLITDLLEHSRIGRTSQPQPVDMNKLVGDVLLDMESSLKAKSAEMEVGELPTLTVYPTEMRLLFQNLLSNALKFQQPGKSPFIRVAASPVDFGNGWHFTVEDNGIGIEEKFHERIFTIFQRLHTAHQFEGTGIGLAHCKKIVELHRGRIWVESVAGEGSRFHFIIREPG